MTHQLTAHIFAISLLICACQAPPPGVEAGESDATETGATSGDGDGDGDGGGDGPVDPLETHFPLVDGAQWTYVATTSAGQVLGVEIVDATETTWEGAPAWILSDNPDTNGEWTDSTIAWLGTATARVHKEVKDANGINMIVDYSPGFVRFDEAWDTVGLEEEILYDRDETDGAGQNPNYEPRGHSFEVIAIDQMVTVPAGTFNCIEIERVRTVGTTAGERVTSWYALGVGKIREERPADQRIEELTSVSIPNGAQYP